jgi:glycosyltransferase involved in cell wall biosynthesis
MASGVPLVSTRVGQAPDLVDSGSDGFLADVEDAEGIAEAVLLVREDRAVAAALAAAGRRTAEEYAYERLDAVWEQLLDGFVVRDERHARN